MCNAPAGGRCKRRGAPAWARICPKRPFLTRSPIGANQREEISAALPLVPAMPVPALALSLSHVAPAQRAAWRRSLAPSTSSRAIQASAASRRHLLVAGGVVAAAGGAAPAVMAAAAPEPMEVKQEPAAAPGGGDVKMEEAAPTPPFKPGPVPKAPLAGGCAEVPCTGALSSGPPASLPRMLCSTYACREPAGGLHPAGCCSGPALARELQHHCFLCRCKARLCAKGLPGSPIPPGLRLPSLPHTCHCTMFT